MKDAPVLHAIDDYVFLIYTGDQDLREVSTEFLLKYYDEVTRGQYAWI